MWLGASYCNGPIKWELGESVKLVDDLNFIYKIDIKYEKTLVM